MSKACHYERTITIQNDDQITGSEVNVVRWLINAFYLLFPQTSKLFLLYTYIFLLSHLYSIEYNVKYCNRLPES